MGRGDSLLKTFEEVEARANYLIERSEVLGALIKHPQVNMSLKERYVGQLEAILAELTKVRVWLEQGPRDY